MQPKWPQGLYGPDKKDLMPFGLKINIWQLENYFPLKEPHNSLSLWIGCEPLPCNKTEINEERTNDIVLKYYNYSKWISQGGGCRQKRKKELFFKRFSINLVANNRWVVNCFSVFFCLFFSFLFLSCLVSDEQICEKRVLTNIEAYKKNHQTNMWIYSKDWNLHKQIFDYILGLSYLR